VTIKIYVIHRIKVLLGETDGGGGEQRHDHGEYAKLTDLLQPLADCPKAWSASIHDPCKAVFEGLRAR
jgi:hypothetical protein